jgi:beta-lactam-binding protein with PASTA domain
MEKKKVYLNTQTKSYRDGVEIDAVALNEAELTLSLSGGRQEFTVIRQSLKAGTTVMKGTRVDVDLAVTGDLPIKVLERVPKQWEIRTVRELGDLVQKDKNLIKILSNNKTAKTLDDSELKVVMAFARANEVVLEPQDAEGIASVYDTARSAFILKGGA